MRARGSSIVSTPARAGSYGFQKRYREFEYLPLRQTVWAAEKFSRVSLQTEVKSEDSRKQMSIDSSLVEVLKRWKQTSQRAGIGRVSLDFGLVLVGIQAGAKIGHVEGIALRQLQDGILAQVSWLNKSCSLINTS